MINKKIFKLSLVLSMIMLSVSCQAQTDSSKNLTRRDEILYNDSSLISNKGFLAVDTLMRIDTIPCVILISDTSFVENVNEYFINKPTYGSTNWISGYSIGFLNKRYLDADKKPLSRNIIVWLSKSKNYKDD